MARLRKSKKSISFQQEKSMEKAEDQNAVSATKRSIGELEGTSELQPHPHPQPSATTTSQSQELDQFTGRKVRKRFGRKLYNGEVRSYDKETKWYWIVYEDGDEEEVDWNDLEKILVPLEEEEPKITPPPITNKRPKKDDFVFW